MNYYQMQAHVYWTDSDGDRRTDFYADKAIYTMRKHWELDKYKAELEMRYSHWKNGLAVNVHWATLELK